MRKTKFFQLITIFILLFHLISYGQQSFKNDQKRYHRYRTAIADKESIIKQKFSKSKISFPPNEIFIRVFKREKVVELWAKATSTDTFTLVTQYPFSASSGSLGPKRKQGDFQIPEGFYFIDRFNPSSRFHLSLEINYPNQSDRILGTKPLGGDIFIHGSNVTIGCIPITDDLIKELYVIAVEVKSNGQDKIPIHIFPTQLTKYNYQKLTDKFNQNKNLVIFWSNLKNGFDLFKSTHRLPIIKIDAKTGEYIFQNR